MNVEICHGRAGLQCTLPRVSLWVPLLLGSSPGLGSLHWVGRLHGNFPVLSGKQLAGVSTVLD